MSGFRYDPQMGIADFAGRKVPVGKWYWWAVGGAIFLAVVIVGAALSDDGNGDPRADEKYPADEARYACQAWVKDGLKAPATAKFSGNGATGSDGNWTITGTVDAENSFGALIRTTWTCNARVEGDDWVGSATLD